MKKLLIATGILLTLTTHADDFRALGAGDMAELAKQSAKALAKCARKDLSVRDADVSNKTAESIDKKVLAQAIQDELKKSGLGGDETSTVQASVKIASKSAERAGSFQTTYTLTSKFTADGKACEAEARLVKESSFK